MGDLGEYVTVATVTAGWLLLSSFRAVRWVCINGSTAPSEEQLHVWRTCYVEAAGLGGSGGTPRMLPARRYGWCTAARPLPRMHRRRRAALEAKLTLPVLVCNRRKPAHGGGGSLLNRPCAHARICQAALRYLPARCSHQSWRGRRALVPWYTRVAAVGTCCRRRLLPPPPHFMLATKSSTISSG